MAKKEAVPTSVEVKLKERYKKYGCVVTKQRAVYFTDGKATVSPELAEELKGYVE